jgi:hypothetical protein
MRTMQTAATTVGRRARSRSRWVLPGLLLALAFALGTRCARGQELVATFPLTPVAESGVRGAAAVAALGDRSSLVAVAVAGLEPGARYRTTLHAGTCDQPSASFTDLVSLAADAAGTATAIGPVRVRGVEDLLLPVLTDGEHIIVLAGVDHAVACGSIPAAASPLIDLQPFIARATSVGCADQRNQLYVIDDQLVLWITRGSCADASHRTALFGHTPDDFRCDLHDSIAGPLRTCIDASVRPMFDIILANDQAPDLGLGPDHRVVLAWSASRSRD